MSRVNHKQVVTKRVVLLAMLFVSFMIVSNLTAFKIVEINVFKHLNVNFPAALVFFPLTYFFDDVLTEVYGFKISRLVIWGGLACSILVTMCTWIVVQLPASPIWDMNTNNGSRAYDLVFKGSSRIFIASIIAYFCGEFLNSVVLAKFKVRTKGQYFSLRIMVSTALGVGVDSVVFCNIAFSFVIPYFMVWKIILTQYIIKVSYEFVMLPVTWMLVNYLKRTDHIDYYDTHTKFNIFSLRLADSK